MTINPFFSLGTKALVADGSAGAKSELVRRGRNPETGKKVAEASQAKAKAEAPKAEAPKAKAKSKAPAAEAPSIFADLSGSERFHALKREAKRLGLDTSGKSAVLEARILAATPESAPESAPESSVDADAIVEGVRRLADAFLAQQAEIASLQAKLARKGGGASKWAAVIADQLARTGINA